MKENGENGYLVGNKMSLADIGLLEILFWVEPLLNDELKPFKSLQVRFVIYILSLFYSNLFRRLWIS